VVGDIVTKEVTNRLLPEIAEWKKATIPAESFDMSYSKGKNTVKIDRRISQANVIIGEKGVSRGNPDYYALNVMNYILGGGGFASRLTEEIRNKRGLAYDVASFFDPGKYTGSFQIVLQTKNATAREAIVLSQEQMGLIRKESVSDKELEGAKKYLIGSFPMRFDTQSKLANFLNQVEYYGLGMDYSAKYPSIINAITKEDVLRVAKKYLNPEETIRVIVADLKEAAVE
jgi:zinc protease